MEEWRHSKEDRGGGLSEVEKRSAVNQRQSQKRGLKSLVFLTSQTTLKTHLTMSERSGKALPERYRKYLIFLHSFSGCDTVTAISGFSKPTLLTKLCKTDKAEGAMDVFNDIRAKKSDIIKAGCELFKPTFCGNPPEDLEDLRFDIISKRTVAGSIKPEKLPLTTGAVAQHSLRAYLQTRDRLLLHCPSLDVLEYGWKQGEQGDCDTLSSSCCKKQGVKRISVCGNCHGNSCQNINQPDDNRSEGDVGELDECVGNQFLSMDELQLCITFPSDGSVRTCAQQKQTFLSSETQMCGGKIRPE
ncbi:hypothetical protein PO909_002529 [Leuciscus waleckii]